MSHDAGVVLNLQMPNVKWDPFTHRIHFPTYMKVSYIKLYCPGHYLLALLPVFSVFSVAFLHGEQRCTDNAMYSNFAKNITARCREASVRGSFSP